MVKRAGAVQCPCCGQQVFTHDVLIHRHEKTASVVLRGNRIGEVKLTPQQQDLLWFLARRMPNWVKTYELIGICWPVDDIEEPPKDPHMHVRVIMHRMRSALSRAGLPLGVRSTQVRGYRLVYTGGDMPPWDENRSVSDWQDECHRLEQEMEKIKAILFPEMFPPIPLTSMKAKESRE